MKVSIIVPCHNEAGRITDTYRHITRILEKLPVEYEIIFEEDGSTDGTGKAIEALSRKDSRVVALSFPDIRKGKGWGFRKLVQKASGDIIISMDADLSTSPDVIPQFLNEMKCADMLITNRYSHPDSRIPLRRRIPSLAYNLALRALFDIHVRDTQSGFKAYRKSVFDRVQISSDGFEYDIELLAKVYREGFRVKEVPVKYIYRKDARFSVAAHGPKMLLKSVRLWRGMKL